MIYVVYTYCAITRFKCQVLVSNAIAALKHWLRNGMCNSSTEIRISCDFNRPGMRSTRSYSIMSHIPALVRRPLLPPAMASLLDRNHVGSLPNALRPVRHTIILRNCSAPISLQKYCCSDCGTRLAAKVCCLEALHRAR